MLANAFVTLALGIVAYALGAWVCARARWLQELTIPVPVVGGLIGSVLFSTLKACGLLEVTFDMFFFEFFMSMFFCSTGFFISLNSKKLVGHIASIAIFLTLLIVGQDILALAVSYAFNQPLAYAVCIGSVPMVGSFGSVSVFASLVEEGGVQNGVLSGMIMAVMGLICGGILGAPIALSLSRKYNISGTNDTQSKQQSSADLASTDVASTPHAAHASEATNAGDAANTSDTAHAAPESQIAATSNATPASPQATPNPGDKLSAMNLVYALLLLLLCMYVGYEFKYFCQGYNTKLPLYTGGIILAVVLNNLGLYCHKDLLKREISVFSNISLNIFISISLMTLDLTIIGKIAAPVTVCMILQVVLIYYFCRLFMHLWEKSYVNILFVAGLIGFGLGALPTGMANVNAIIKKHGYNNHIYLLLPLASSLCDCVNGTVAIIMVNALS